MRKLWFIAAALLCVVLVLGCGNRGTAGAGARTSSQMYGRQKGTLPLADGSVTLDIFIGGLDQFVTSMDYADNLTTSMIVDETGINLNIITSTRTDAVTRRNVLLSSGDYPEVVHGGGRDVMVYYAQEEIFIALDDYDLLDYPRINWFFDLYPFVYDIITVADGTIRGLPAVNHCDHCTDDAGRIFYYMPWLR